MTLSEESLASAILSQDSTNNTKESMATNKEGCSGQVRKGFRGRVLLGRWLSRWPNVGRQWQHLFLSGFQGGSYIVHPRSSYALQSR